MKRLLVLACLPVPAMACDAPICLVDALKLDLTQIITFDDQRAAFGPGHRIDDRLVLPGASFGERFAGQTLGANGDFDIVEGAALPMLTLLPGARGQNLSVMKLMGTNLLNGYGPAGHPRPQAQGEGAIAVLFDHDQSALSFDIVGGEQGAALIQFVSRTGQIIHIIALDKLTEQSVGFRRKDGLSDIAGFVLTNSDPQGLAIDNLRFGPPPVLG